MYFTKTESGEFVPVSDKLYSESEFKAVKDKNNELRQTNVTLLKTNESLSAFADVLDGATNVTPEALIKKIDLKAAERASTLVTEMKAKYETQVKELNEQLGSTSGTLSKLLLGSEVAKAGAKHGVIATAAEDVARRASDVFMVKDGALVPKVEKLDAEGKPYSVDAFMADLTKSAPYFFAPSQGPDARRNANVKVAPNKLDNARAVDRIAGALAARSST